jgi:hypothetical protein
MRLIEINYPKYTLQHKHGYSFEIRAYKPESGGLAFEPIVGWDALSVFCQQDPESLLEDIDDAIFNATPEQYEQS